MSPTPPPSRDSSRFSDASGTAPDDSMLQAQAARPRVSGAAGGGAHAPFGVAAPSGPLAGLANLADLAARLLAGAGAHLHLLTGDRTATDLAETAGLPPAVMGTPSTEDALCALVATTAEPLVIPDATADERAAHVPAVTSGQLGAYLGAPLTDSAGHIIGALCVFDPAPRTWSPSELRTLQQLAAAAAAEVELAALSGTHRTSQLVLDLALGAARIGVFDIDLTAGTRSWDDRMLELSGYSHADFDPAFGALDDRVHPEDRVRVSTALQRAIETGGTYEEQYRVLLPDGQLRWITARGRALSDEHGRTVRVLGAAQDTTAVHEGQARTAAMLDSMALGYLAMDAHWRVTYINTEAERIAQASRTDLVGKDFWAAYPATVGTEFERSYRRAVATGQTVTFDAFYPQPLNAWVEVRAVPEHGGLASYFLDITARRAAEDARDAALRQQSADARAMASLVIVARELGTADTEAEVLDVLSSQGVPLLGAVGATLMLRQPDGEGVRGLSHNYSEAVRGHMNHMPVDYPLPAVHTAMTGTPHLLSDRAAATALFPDGEDLYRAGGVEASASVPLHARDQLLGCLSMGFDHVRSFSPADHEVLEAFAALTAQALDRIAAREAERTASQVAARFSETLQRSLLTSPPEPDHLQIAVRYSPAAADAQVGGDWYDAFMTSEATTSLVIGDVTGHDQEAAAAMGQLRNLLRGIGHAIGDPSAAVLSALDRAVHDLAVDAMATIVLAQVEQTPEHRAAGTRLLRWSNAGHPPPLLITPDGEARLLDTEPDLLIGLDPDTGRHDHTVVLQPGATVLLYTDGLIERRDAPLDAGLAWLADTAGRLSHLDLEDLCDELLAQVGGQVDDDVALLALRAHREDRPRPAEAGPGTNPRRAPTLDSRRSDGRRGGDDGVQV